MEQGPDELENASAEERQSLSDEPREPAGGGDHAGHGAGNSGDEPREPTGGGDHPTDGPGNVSVDEPTDPALGSSGDKGPSEEG